MFNIYPHPVNLTNYMANVWVLMVIWVQWNKPVFIRAASAAISTRGLLLGTTLRT
jgi:hypothetical protein